MPNISKQGPGGGPKNTAEKRSVLDRIKPIGFDPNDGIKINLYGRPGTGKTTLWSTFPKPILAMICSGSAQPGEMRSIDTEENRKSIMEVTLEASSELKELVTSRLIGDYRTIVLDHATGFQDLVLKEILGLDELPVQLGWGTATQQEYGQLAVQVKEAFRHLLSLRQNVVIIAQEREFNTESGSDVISPFVASSLTPSICGYLNSSVDYICQTFIRQKEVVREVTTLVGGKPKKQQLREKTREVEYCLRTSADPTYIVKFRRPKGRALPPIVVDPDYDKLIELIRPKDFPTG